jgi:hypothetical protein
MRIQDPAEKVKARQELVTGALGDKLKLLSKLLVSHMYSAELEEEHGIDRMYQTVCRHLCVPEGCLLLFGVFLHQLLA